MGLKRFPSFYKTNMLTPTPGERLTASPAVVLLLFFLILLASQAGQAAVGSVAVLLLPDGADHGALLLVQLFSTVATVAAVLLYCLLGERRSLTSLGLIRRGAVCEYAVGLLGGLLMFGGAVLICVATETVTVRASSQAFSWGMAVLFLFGFLIQGMSEELLCRSYLMVSLSRGFSLWACAVINALLFSVLHIGNHGISAVALVNIFLFGLFASFLTLRRGSIWMAGALHSMWNFAQGNLLGIPVSGIQGIPAPLSSELAEGKWQEFINGGVFGLEGGLAVTLVLTVSCTIALFMPTKKAEIADNTNSRIKP